MPGRLLTVPGLFRDDEVFLAGFARGAESDCALCATRSLLERWQGELLQRLPGGVLTGLRLMLFPGLARRILGPAVPAPATETVRRTVMGLVLARLGRAGELRVLTPLAASPSLAADLLIAVGELKRGLVSAEELRRLAERDPNLADLLLCWREYDLAMRSIGQVDGDGLLSMAAEALRTGSQEKPDFERLLVHGFTDLSPLQASLLRALADSGVMVTVLLPRPDPFAPQAALHEAIQEHFPGWPGESLTRPSPDITGLDRLLAGHMPSAVHDASVIELSAEGESPLASLIARAIRARLAADPALKTDEIAVVRRDSIPGGQLTADLRRHGLPVEDEIGAPLLSLNGVGTVIAALDCLGRDWPRDSVLRLARGVFVGGEASLADTLAHVSAKARVVQTREAWEDLLVMEGTGPFAGDDETETPDASPGAAVYALGRLRQGLALLPASGTTGEFLQALRAFIAHWRLPETWRPGGS